MTRIRYRTDLPDRELFVGRAHEVAELVAAMTEGVNSIAAVMGARHGQELPASSSGARSGGAASADRSR